MCNKDCCRQESLVPRFTSAFISHHRGRRTHNIDIGGRVIRFEPTKLVATP